MAKGTGQKLGSLYMELELDDSSFKKDFDKLRQTYGKTMKMDLGINAAGFVSGTRTAQHAQKGLNDQMLLTNKTMMSQRQLGIQLSNQFGTLFSIYAAERFVRKLAEVTGMFELQHASMKAIIGDAVAADKIFSQIKGLSVESPFRFKDLISYTKQLAAFSVPTNELYETMKNLADVSAGLGVDMGRITLAFGQVKAASVLRGQELRQFTEAGIPLVAELAKKFTELEGKTVSAGQVFERISKRMVSFEMVKDIFDDMTSAGGKFYQMQEIQAATLAGKISNLADAFDIALASMGDSQSELLKGGVDMLTGLTRNWEELVKVVISAIAIMGTYKAAAAFAAAATRGWTAAEMAHYAVLVVVEKAQRLLNSTMMKNPYALAAVLIVSLVAAIWTLQDATTTQQKAQAALNDENKKALEQKEALSGKIGKLVGIINSETSALWEQVRAYEELQKVAPSVTKGQTLAQFKAQGSESQQFAISAFESQSEIDAKTQAYSRAVSELEKGKKLQAEMLNQRQAGGQYNKIDIAFLTEKAKLAKGELDDIKRLQQEADFLLLPEKTRIDILKQRQQLLLAEKEKLTANKNLVMASTDGLSGWGSAIDPFEFRLKAINTELEKTGVMLRGIKPADSEMTAKEKIEKEIKSLQEALDALSPEAAKTSGLKTKIRNLQELLKAYDIPNIAKQQKDADKDAADELKARISLIEEAYSAYTRLLEAQGLTSKTATPAQREAAKSAVKSDSRFKNVNISDSGIASNYTAMLDANVAKKNGEQVIAVLEDVRKKRSDVQMDELIDNQKALTTLANDYATYIERVNKINKDADANVLLAGADSGRVAEINVKRKEQLDQIQEEYAKRSDEYKELMIWMADMSVAEVEAEMQSILQLLKSGRASTPEQQAAWQQMYVELEKKYKELVADKAKDKKDTSFKDFKKTVTALNNVQSAVDGLIGSFDDMDAGVKAALAAISETASGTVKILEGISAATAEGISAAEKASVILTVVSYAIQIVTSVINAFKSAEKERKQAAEDLKKANLDAYFNLIDYNKELRESLDLSQEIGETRLKWLKDENDAILKNIDANKKDTASLIAKLYAEGKYTSSASANIKGAKFYAFDKLSWAQIQQLELQGKLDSTGQEIYDRIVASKKEGEDLADSWLSYLESAREMFTGTTYDAISDSIMNGFEEGKRGAADFADTFEDLMQSAVRQSLSLLADEGIRSWYEDFATASRSDGVLTPDEQAELRSKWEALINALGAEATSLEQITGVSIEGKSSSSNSLRGNIENIKEDTATKLSGYIAGIAQDSTMGRYNQALIANALTEDGIMIKSEGLMQEVRENIGAMRANSDMMARVMGRFDSCIVSGNNGMGVRVI